MKTLKAILFIAGLMVFLSAGAQQDVLYNNGPIYIQSGENLHVQGGFVNMSSGTVSNAGTMHVSGNWTNNASSNVFTAQQGTVILNGSNQLIGGNATTFHDLECQGGIKKLDVNSAVSHLLNLGDAEISTAAYLLEVSNPDTAAIQRTTGFISTGTLGYLRRHTSGVGSWLYPLGSNMLNLPYRPALISPVGGGNTVYDMTFLAGDPTSYGFDISSSVQPVCIVNHRYALRISRYSGNSVALVNCYFDDFQDGAFTMPVKWVSSAWEYINASQRTLNTSPALSYFSLQNFNLQNPVVIALADSAPPDGTPIIYAQNDTLYAGQGMSFQWYLNGNLIPNATQSYYVPVVSGNYTVFVTINAHCSFLSGAYSFSMPGLNESAFKDIHVYPNPFRDKIIIEFTECTGEPVLCILYNSNGKRVYQAEFDSPNSSLVIRTNHLAGGIYLLQLISDDLSFEKKMVLK